MIVLNTEIKPIPINQKLKRGLGNRLYSSKEYKQSWSLIGYDWMKQYRGELLNGYVDVQILHSYKRYDVDAISKSVLDTLQGIAYKNDKQVLSYSVKKDIESKNEYLVVIVRGISFE